MTVTSDAAVLEVLGDEPATTHQVRTMLAHKANIHFDEVPIYRLRRTLERLEARGDIVGSGGPKREVLPDWPNSDGRDVVWAKADVAENIARVHAERVAFEKDLDRERATLLRDLKKRLRPFERVAIGYDPDYDDPIHFWPIERLRVVAALAEEARG